MSAVDPIGLMFGGMEKLGPGDNTHTLHVLRLLSKQQFDLVVDAGCGAGRQTLALAQALGTVVNAVDSHQPFLADLERRARQANVQHLVRTHHMDMQDIPTTFRNVDLLWSEGAAYSIGFANALTRWAPVLAPTGFVVVSELSWLTDRPPAAVLEFFRTGYPDMRSVQQNVAAATDAGYTPITTHTLPEHTWVDGYYDVLAPRARALMDHASSEIREFAADTLREIEIFESSEGSYGYVFYVLQRNDI